MATAAPTQSIYLTEQERATFALLLSRVEQADAEERRNEATHIREQLALHGSYADACARIEQYAEDVRRSRAPLVPMRFPIRLTQKTRESVENGMFRSFLCFLETLHALAVQDLGDAEVPDANALLMRVANVLTLESCRVLDRAAMVQQARDVCVSYIERQRREVVDAEYASLRTLADACTVVIDCLQRFAKEVTKMGMLPEAAWMQLFLRRAARKGLGGAAARMQQENCTRALVRDNAWMHGKRLDDDAHMRRVHARLVAKHNELREALEWHRARIAWLRAQPAPAPCWCGLSVAPSAEGALLQAPAHLRVFAGEERVGVGPQPASQRYRCHLGVVSVANVVLEVVRGRQLPLNRISASYANRVLTFDFCKYERAAQNIWCDTLHPWLTQRMSEARGAQDTYPPTPP